MKFTFLNKTVLGLSLLLVMGFGLVSCEKLGLTAPKMDTAEAVQRVFDTYAANVDTTQYKPIEIKWYEIDKLSNELMYMNIESVSKDDNKVYSQSSKIAGDNQAAGEIELSKYKNRTTYDFEKLTWISLSDIDVDVIVKQIEDAKAQIPEEYIFKSVSEYTIEVNQRSKELKSEFEIRLTKRGEPTETRGRQIITNYYEVEFIGLPDGTAKMKD